MNEKSFDIKDICGNSVVTVPDESEINEGAPRPVKRIAAIHDLSCFGRCALTVVIPTLSAMGYQVVPVPTALLSTHTGGFSGMHFLDTTDSISQISEHFTRLGLTFDAIYTGFLGSEAQISLVEAFIKQFGKDGCYVAVDPVMGDDGMLYATYSERLARGMSQLCAHADLITPNLTEAAFITGKEYKNTSVMTSEERNAYLGDICEALEAFGKKRIVITGIHDGDDRLLTYGIDPDSGSFCHSVKRVPKNYPGTGDLFASVLIGDLLRTDSLSDSARFASEFTSRVMLYTSRFDTPARDGVALEAFICELAEHAIPHIPNII